MGSELQVIIKMVDEVVKPLLTLKNSLESTEGDLSQVKGELSTLTYQFIALYECLEKESKVFTQRSRELKELEERFITGLESLEAVPQTIDQSVQSGIKGASQDLKKAVQDQVRTGLQTEVDPAVRSLREVVNQSRESLATYEAITWIMHFKIIIIATVCGIAIGMGSFFALSRKIDRLRCECLCVLTPQDIVNEKNQETKEPISSVEPQPTKKEKKIKKHGS